MALLREQGFGDPGGLASLWAVMTEASGGSMGELLQQLCCFCRVRRREDGLQPSLGYIDDPIPKASVQTKEPAQFLLEDSFTKLWSWQTS